MDPGRAPQNLTRTELFGKHSGMLATTAANGWDLATYLDPEHPLQQAITAAVARLSGTAVGAIAVDGCGAPLHGIPLTGLAHAFGRIAAAPQATPRRGSPTRSTPTPNTSAAPAGVTTLIRETPADQRLIARGRRRRVGVCRGAG